MSRLLVVLRVLIVLGAFAGIAQTQAHFSLMQFQPAGLMDPSWSVCSLDPRTLVKFALTAVTLALL